MMSIERMITAPIIATLAPRVLHKARVATKPLCCRTDSRYACMTIRTLPKGGLRVKSRGNEAKVGAASDVVGETSGGGAEEFKTLGLAAVCVATGIANRVTYKMALVPLKDFVFFLAQFQTFGYVAIYSYVLYMRHRAGLVTDEMLSVPKNPFAIIGICDALGQVSMLIGAARLPGVLLPLFQPAMVVWQLILSGILLRQRYSLFQMLGAALVIGGGTTVALSSMSGTGPISASPVPMAFYIIGLGFPAISVIFKEKIFTEAKERMGGKDLDIFVVNTFGSIAQAVCVFLLLPALTALRNMPLSELPDYLVQGSQCFFGINPACGSDCAGAPILPLVYIVANLAFNVSALNLLRRAGSVYTVLSLTLIIPLTVFAFTLPLPYLGAQSQLSALFLLGCVLVCGGNLLYNQKDISAPMKKKKT